MSNQYRLRSAIKFLTFAECMSTVNTISDDDDQSYIIYPMHDSPTGEYASNLFRFIKSLIQITI